MERTGHGCASVEPTFGMRNALLSALFTKDVSIEYQWSGFIYSGDRASIKPTNMRLHEASSDNVNRLSVVLRLWQESRAEP